ncbi:MAG: class I SAM-dependent methyltransferase [Candidatus Paracaedibacter sp.]
MYNNKKTQHMSLINKEIKHTVDLIFSYGISIHSVIMLKLCGILSILEKKEEITLKDISEFLPNISLVPIKSALLSLTFTKIINHENSIYKLTPLGKEVINSLEEFMLWFGAYSNLCANAADIVLGKTKITDDYINGALVGTSSAKIGEKNVDPYFFKVLDKLELQGTIGDLGCGSGERLQKICDKYNLNGIGIDINQDAIDYAKKNNNSNKNLSFIVNDVTALVNQWPEVSLIFQAFMTHHIIPDNHCINVLSDYKKSFPNAKYLIILDTVLPEEYTNEAELFTPGFLFVHGLQGLEPRRRQDILHIFKKANFNLIEEVKLSVPNSYLWLLEM